MLMMSCHHKQAENPMEEMSAAGHAAGEIFSGGLTIAERFPAPSGYKRKPVPENSFAFYLRNLPLKPHGTKVQYYNGAVKDKAGVYTAVVDLPIGNRDLHQCADAVMRLYAEYLYQQKRYNEICFNFLSDGKPRCFDEHVAGNRSYQSFWKYMEYVFAFANTGSLYDQMLPVKHIRDLKPGDVFIEKKTPYGHAVLVADMAVDESGNPLYLLVQSYMPAQEIQVLVNPSDGHLSPWYKITNGTLITPEWRFQPHHARKF
jgi:hypothetical protein